MAFNPIICVDFDGVIHSYTSGWKGVDVIPDPPVPGAIEWLKSILPVPEALGGNIYKEYNGPIAVIYSSRSKDSEGILAMQKWLVNNGLDESYVIEGILSFPKQKPPAWLTIDDRAICFNGVFPTKDEMLNFKPWYKGK